MIRNLTILSLLLLFGLGCQLNQSTDSDIVIDVDDDFKLTFRENLTTAADDLLFELESINSRECEADTLLMHLDNFPTAVRIDVNVVNTSGPCLPGSIPAKTQVTSAGIDRPRVALFIHLEDLVDNQGDIIKNDRDISLEMETTHGFYLPYETLLRVPRSSIWGYVGFTPALRQEAQTFLERFQRLTKSIEVEEGQYGHFTVNKDKKVVQVLGQEDLVMYTQPFLRSFSVADEQTIKGLFEEYQEKYPTMRFVFYNSFGGKFPR